MLFLKQVAIALVPYLVITILFLAYYFLVKNKTRLTKCVLLIVIVLSQVLTHFALKPAVLNTNKEIAIQVQLRTNRLLTRDAECSDDFLMMEGNGEGSVINDLTVLHGGILLENYFLSMNKVTLLLDKPPYKIEKIKKDTYLIYSVDKKILNNPDQIYILAKLKKDGYNKLKRVVNTTNKKYSELGHEKK